MSVRILSPEGGIGRPAVARAASPDVLAGRRLIVLDNGKPGAELLLSRVAQKLAARAGIVFGGVRRKRTAATPCEVELLRALGAEAELALTGTAD
jgi:hypothetical protein